MRFSNIASINIISTELGNNFFEIFKFKVLNFPNSNKNNESKLSFLEYLNAKNYLVLTPLKGQMISSSGFYFYTGYLQQ